MSPSSQSNELDLVRIIGRCIFGVSVLLALMIFVLSGVEPGGWKAIPWNPVAISTAVGFLMAGAFAWGGLRGLAQIRDRVEDGFE